MVMEGGGRADSNKWSLVYEGYDPEQQGLRETICTLGNGYFCTRGAFEWTEADDINYPGTYLAGGYNRLETEIAGRMTSNEDLVNIPNWLSLTFRMDKGAWFHINAVEIMDCRQELDLKGGVTITTLHFRDKEGRETTLRSTRLVHMEDPHMAAIEMTLTPHNWSGAIEFRSALDGRVINAGVRRYRILNRTHLTPLEGLAFHGEKAKDEMIGIAVETCQSKLRIGMAARTRIIREGTREDLSPVTETEKGFASQTFATEIREGQSLSVEKIISLHSSRDIAISEPALAAREAVDRAPFFAPLLETHRHAWERLWNRGDMQIEDGRDETQMILRLHIFHLLQTLSHNTIALDVGVPARGWHGEAYRGHVFWDELFILPFINYRIPALSRSMLRYRFNRLPKARIAAEDAGFRGAMFPWQSGSDGREESQIMHLNPNSGHWLSDNTWTQRHVSLAIAYNVWQYYQVTGEKNFLMIRGAEMIIDIARFFASLASYDQTEDRYNIHQVMGPDEYHDAYPGSDQPGLSNNAYTNVLVSWLMETVIKIIDVLDVGHRAEILAMLGVEPAEFDLWEKMSRRMKVVFHDDGIISQFEGYGDLKEFDWEGYRKKYGDIQRLDRILEAEGENANSYKLSKQADVLMLFYLFSLPKLKDRFTRLGYEFTDDMWQRNIDYYMARTSHGSTLSYLVHSWVLAKSDPDRAWEHFTRTLYSDVTDIQGGTTAEGIHLGAMAGTVDLVQRCFTGLDVRDGFLHFDPVLTDRLKSLKLKLRYLGHWLDVHVTPGKLSIKAYESWTESVPISVKGETFDLEPGKTHEFDL